MSLTMLLLLLHKGEMDKYPEPYKTTLRSMYEFAKVAEDMLELLSEPIYPLKATQAMFDHVRANVQHDSSKVGFHSEWCH